MQTAAYNNRLTPKLPTWLKWRTMKHRPTKCNICIAHKSHQSRNVVQNEIFLQDAFLQVLNEIFGQLLNLCASWTCLAMHTFWSIISLSAGTNASRQQTASINSHLSMMCTIHLRVIAIALECPVASKIRPRPWTLRSWPRPWSCHDWSR